MKDAWQSQYSSFWSCIANIVKFYIVWSSMRHCSKGWCKRLPSLVILLFIGLPLLSLGNQPINTMRWNRSSCSMPHFELQAQKSPRKWLNTVFCEVCCFCYWRVRRVQENKLDYRKAIVYFIQYVAQWKVRPTRPHIFPGKIPLNAIKNTYYNKRVTILYLVNPRYGFF